MSMTGTLQKALLNGISFEPISDVSITKKPSKQVEAVSHTGGNAFKVTISAAQIEGIKVFVPSGLKATLEAMIGETIDITIIEADGSSSSGRGTITFDGISSEDNTAEITAIPEKREFTYRAA